MSASKCLSDSRAVSIRALIFEKCRFAPPANCSVIKTTSNWLSIGGFHTATVWNPSTTVNGQATGSNLDVLRCAMGVHCWLNRIFFGTSFLAGNETVELSVLGSRFDRLLHLVCAGMIVIGFSGAMGLCVGCGWGNGFSLTRTRRASETFDFVYNIEFLLSCWLR